MKNFQWFRQISSHSRSGRRSSSEESSGPLSWTQYLVSTGGEIKADGEEDWSADMSQLYIGGKFASGRHSTIHHGRYKDMDVAVKIMYQSKEDENSAASLEKKFNSEVALLLRLQHSNIISFVAACKKPPVFCIVTEYMSGGSLRRYLQQHEPHSVPLDLVLKLALDIARGMDYLHSQGILHRDLKSDNLLLGEDICVKVADFGISCLESECGSEKGFVGTYRWMAPEMIKDKHHTRKVDVYSFGIILWELLTALVPFHDMTPEQVAFAVSLKNLRPPLPTACPFAFSHLINRCWSSNPDKRPHFNEIILILESYTEAFEQDPTFFSTYKPSPFQIFRRCIPKCIAFKRCASLKA